MQNIQSMQNMQNMHIRGRVWPGLPVIFLTLTDQGPKKKSRQFVFLITHQGPDPEKSHETSF